jgi:hypothetical protein
MCPTQQKDDAAEIVSIIRELSEQDWLKGNREWWPKYVFHYTDVRNAVEILRSGKLLCRSEVDKHQGMIVDNASRNIMAQTDAYVRDFVRLYFRPQTPTQYNNEGIRPRSQRKLESHCPVPVFFLFDSVDVLTRAESRFSSGNLAVEEPSLCSTAEELAKFDFKKIYHVGPFQEYLKGTIIYHRNAEVVIPTEMDLAALRFIFCRSPAEKETFMHLLPPEISLKWNMKILIASKSQIYNCKWTFVETVEMDATRAAISFSPDTITPGPFNMTVIITDINTGDEYDYKILDFYANKGLHVGIPKGVNRYNIKLTLDDDLAFTNDYYGEEIPF